MSDSQYKPPVGDLTSTEIGSGARFNEGKPRWDLMLFRHIAFISSNFEEEIDFCPADVWSSMSTFQVCQTLDTAQLLLLDTVNLGSVEKPNQWDFLDEVCDVWEAGAKIYSSWNWATGMNWSHALSSMARHLRAIEKEEFTDPETGLSHTAHITCNAMMLAHWVNYFPDLNDLPPTHLFKLTK
jgi:hypothetical protein